MSGIPFGPWRREVTIAQFLALTAAVAFRGIPAKLALIPKLVAALKGKGISNMGELFKGTVTRRALALVFDEALGHEQATGMLRVFLRFAGLAGAPYVPPEEQSGAKRKQYPSCHSLPGNSSQSTGESVSDAPVPSGMGSRGKQKWGDNAGKSSSKHTFEQSVAPVNSVRGNGAMSMEVMAHLKSWVQIRNFSKTNRADTKDMSALVTQVIAHTVNHM
jgi:hypothetical protein